MQVKRVESREINLSSRLTVAEAHLVLHARFLGRRMVRLQDLPPKDSFLSVASVGQSL